MTLLHYWWLLPIGLAVGVFGTLIGAGGGFILAPLLMLLYPADSADTITCISLAVVFCNAASGSVAYARMKRIDYRTGLLFSVATVPGAILGAVSTGYIPRQQFNAIFGTLMMCIALFLIFSPHPEEGSHRKTARRGVTHTLVEADGTVHTYTFSPGLGMFLSGIVGFLSSLLGTGGGTFHVPAMIRILNFPVHIATATSHFVLAIMALTGTAVHIATGAFHHGVRRTLVLAIGILIGAQIGARLSSRVHGSWIVRLLAVALAMLGLRICLTAF